MQPLLHLVDHLVGAAGQGLVPVALLVPVVRLAPAVLVPVAALVRHGLVALVWPLRVLPLLHLLLDLEVVVLLGVALGLLLHLLALPCSLDWVGSRAYHPVQVLVPVLALPVLVEQPAERVRRLLVCLGVLLGLLLLEVLRVQGTRQGASRARDWARAAPGEVLGDHLAEVLGDLPGEGLNVHLGEVLGDLLG